MTVNPKLFEAAAIFTELGWNDAQYTDALTLPLGTGEQRRTALAGLRSGDWGEVAQLSETTYGWRSHVDVDTAMLGLFAVRLGVDARRATGVMTGTRRVPDELATDVLASRGPAFAAKFVEHACSSSRRAWEHCTSAYAGAAVRLVDRHDLPVPAHQEYLKDWSVYALGVLTGDVSELFPAERGLCAEEVIRRRFAEHVRTAVAVGLNATGPFGAVLPAGVRHGWLERDEAIELVFGALDAAARPGDRKVWAWVLTGDLAVPDGEIADRADALVPVLASGDAALIEGFAPILIARVPEESLPDVLTVSLTVTTKKAQRTVLSAIADRARPSAVVREAVAPLITPFTTGRDRAVVRAARVACQAWGLDAESESVPAPTPGVWQPTPPVWKIPRFDPGPASPEALTEAAATLLGRGRDGVVDVESERFLVLAQRVAREDPASARAALRGVREVWAPGLRPVLSWVNGEPTTAGLDRGRVHDPATARDYAVFQRLEQLPCLLSAPSWVDLRIDPADLADRLRSYAASDAAACEADLFLALTRVDTGLVTGELLKRLGKLRVPVLRASGKAMSRKAGPAARRYLLDPVREPELRFNRQWGHWEPAPLIVPDSLRDFPDRLGHPAVYGKTDIETFPTWGDAAMTHIGVYNEPHEGVQLRQLARRATPLPAGAAINLLSAQRSFHPAAAADGSAAVLEAWRRGLLRPGSADVTYLDWSRRPSGLAALAGPFTELAGEGLLSVVWPVLDDLLAVCARESRVPPGTADLAEAMLALVPAVRSAVDTGAADQTVLDLPGVRALAARPGSARAVTVARELTADLPEAITVGTEAKPAATLDPPFEELWPDGAGTAPAIDDGVEITANWSDPDAPTRLLTVDLTLPDRPEHRYRVQKGWTYDLEYESQCSAHEYPRAEEPPDRPHAADRAWLHWDATAGRVTVSPTRCWVHGSDRPLCCPNPLPPLSVSMIAVLLCITAQDGDHARGGQRAIERLVDNGTIGSASVTRAVRALLSQPAVSPAKLVRTLERHPATLPALWPLLTEPIAAASATTGPLPRWLNPVLDVALRFAPQLATATRHDLIPPEAAGWPGLPELAARTGKTAAVTKSQKLLATFGG